MTVLDDARCEAPLRLVEGNPIRRASFRVRRGNHRAHAPRCQRTSGTSALSSVSSWTHHNRLRDSPVQRITTALPLRRLPGIIPAKSASPVAIRISIRENSGRRRRARHHLHRAQVRSWLTEVSIRSAAVMVWTRSTANPNADGFAVGSPVIRGGSLLLSASRRPQRRHGMPPIPPKSDLKVSFRKPLYSQFRGIGPIHTFSTNEDQTFRIRAVEFDARAEGEFRWIWSWAAMSEDPLHSCPLSSSCSHTREPGVKGDGPDSRRGSGDTRSRACVMLR